MLEEEFVKRFMCKLDGKIDDSSLKTIVSELRNHVSDYSITERETGLVVLDDTINIFQTYMVTKKIEGRSDRTLNLYGIILKEALDKMNKPLTEITANDIRIYLYEAKKKRSISDRTLDSRRLILSSFFTWCNDEGYIKSNPSAAVSPIKYEVKPRQPFSDIELESIREACLTIRERAIVEVLYSSGCRVSELVGLKKQDIDLITRDVYLFGKGKKHRTSSINARSVLLLKKYWATRQDDSEYAFVGDRAPHKNLSANMVERVVRKIGKRCGIEGACPHRFRHTMATDCVKRGMPLPIVQTLLGHEKPETTGIYVKVNQENVKYNYSKCII